MTSHPTTEELYEAHIKQITGARAREIHAHLQECSECRQVLLDYQKLEESFVQQPLETPSPRVLEAIRLKARKSTEKPRERLLWAFLRWDRAVGFAVVAVMAVGIGILYRTGFHEKISDEQPPATSVLPAEPRPVKPPPVAVPVVSPPTGLEKREAETARPIAAKKEKIAPVDYDIEGAYQEFEAAEATPSPSGTAEEKRDVGGGPAKGLVPSLTAVPPITEADRLLDEALEKQPEKQTGGVSCPTACGAYEAIVKKYPNFVRLPDVLFNWAVCLERLGCADEARKKLNQLEQMNPSYPGLLEAKGRLMEK
ncbi:MAG: hypothetical protein HYU99_05110 [Deltaproteobacteria bacterium]|nr:hypothetical protein [Deltaproteobacteria bacterium]